uniref:Large ribosomal subunit protein uL30m n=1 Tax=Tetraselmis sp. GSL018 TaxID=582737 RepID=A0A061SAJ9_9CHLO|eukprot:CAMPEP_0177591918 /NCGR_PEP_ID=MMETSP0419_2-20121207/8268_1 /TAXON_ID=582737 /ORGANISM="Tetraselmis sp., Strain GSL018" /LENGTH=87 /DNA_ID=CAMNT_0019082721 /DNA_START=31 /DNA_END=294 /DNA_ORIENTATION=-
MSDGAGRLVITLVRGLAGKKEAYKATCERLGLTKAWRTTEKPNNASIRGMIHKVRHLVRVETLEMYQERLAQEAARKALRPPLVVRH